MNIATSLDALNTVPDVVRLGQTMPYFSSPLVVYTPSMDVSTFYLRLDPGYNMTVAPFNPVSMEQSGALSLIPSVSPGTYITSNITFVLNISYVCDSNGAAINVSINNFPFAPSQFQYFKQCCTCTS